MRTNRIDKVLPMPAVAALFVFAVMLLSACGPQSQLKKNTGNYPNQIDDVWDLYSLSLLKKQPDQIDSLLQAVGQGRPTVIKIEKGSVIPLVIKLENEVAQILEQRNQVSLRFREDLYAYFDRQGIRLSRDGLNWSDIKDVNALKQLLNITRGGVQVELQKTQGRDVTLVLEINSHPF